MIEKAEVHPRRPSEKPGSYLYTDDISARRERGVTWTTRRLLEILQSSRLQLILI